jgi:hypothetical protein
MLATLAFVAVTAAGMILGLGAIPSSPATRARTGRRRSRRPSAGWGPRRPPGYYPARLAWPPAEIRVAGGRRGSVRLTFVARHGGPGLEMLAAIQAGDDINPALLAGRTVLSSRRTVVAGHPATLGSVLVEGDPWQELSWSVDGRAVVLRTQGDLDELMRIAHSLHGSGK